MPPEEAPASRFDLIDLLRPEASRYAGRVATYDIEASGLGYLFAFADSQAATTFGSLIEAFGRSGAVATCCSAEIIDGVAEGRYLVAYNVLGSYAFARAAEDPRIAVVAPEDYTLVLVAGGDDPARRGEPGGGGRVHRLPAVGSGPRRARPDLADRAGRRRSHARGRRRRASPDAALARRCWSGSTSRSAPTSWSSGARPSRRRDLAPLTLSLVRG